MTTRYRFDSGRSRFTVQAFATGTLSFFGHSPTFAVRRFAGVMNVDPTFEEAMSLELTVFADSLELEDRVSPNDRREIEDRMRRDVLETRTYPEITFRSETITAERPSRGVSRLRIGGLLTLHGVTRTERIGAELQISDDWLRLRGEYPLLMSEYRIRPVSALGGTIQLKDEVRISFDLTGLAEKP